MKIRDAHARLSGDKTEYDMPSGELDIIASGGRPLFSIALEKDGSIRISSGQTCKHIGVVLDDCLLVRPRASNLIIVIRPEYSPG